MRTVLATLVWLRYRLFVHRIRWNKFQYAILGLMFLILALSGSFLFGALFYEAQRLLHTEDSVLLREVVHLYCLLIFFAWASLSLFWGMCSPGMAHISQMAQFPLSFRRLYGANLLSGLVDYWIVVFGPVFVWLVVSLTSADAPLATFSMAFSVMLFVGATYLLVYVSDLCLGMSFKFLSYKKLFAAVLAAILVVVLVIAASCFPAVDGYLLQLRLSEYSIFTPPGLLAELLLAASAGRYLSWAGYGLGLLGYLGLGWWAGYRLTRWRVFEKAFRARTNIQQRQNSFERLFELVKTFIPSFYLPITVKDLLYLMRNPRMKLLLALVAIWTISFPAIYTAASAAIAPKHLLWFLGYTLVLTWGGWENLFGLESKGMVNNYLLPVHKRQVVVGKNLALGLLQLTSMAPGLLWTLYLCWKNGIWWEGISMMASLFYLMASRALFGNVSSLRFPIPMQFNQIMGPWKIVPGAGVVSILGLLCAVLPLAGGVYLFHYLYPRPQAMAGTVVFLCALMLALYRLSLPRVERIFEERKEQILMEFRAHISA
ncbi:MAG TPA: hypothetical protein EYP53_01165 [Candidatus Latescibacteria bacterium]|nr:hypothetical protein [Candidatus Latescibacterota bacterium]